MDIMAQLQTEAREFMERREAQAAKASEEQARADAEGMGEEQYQEPKRWSASERREVREVQASRSIGCDMAQADKIRRSASKASRTAMRKRTDGADQHGKVVVWSAAKIREVYGA